MEVLHLGYHYVRDSKAPGPNCSPNRLRAHLVELKKNGYEFITHGEIARLILAQRPMPQKCALLSFDDGVKDQYTTAFPILKEFGIRATFNYITCVLGGKLPPVIGFQILIDKFGAERIEKEILPEVFKGTPYMDLLDHKRYDVSERKVGEPMEMRRIKWMFNHFPSQAFKRDKINEMFSRFVGEGAQEEIVKDWFMTKEELVEMARVGMEITSHSHTHPPFDISGKEEIKYELSESKKILDNLFGKTTESFCWPFGGYYSEAVKQLVADAGYFSAWNFSSPLIKMPEDPYKNIYDIPRLNEMRFLPDIK